ncbi:MAG: sodium:solute symporter family protein [Desulfovibrio sp.]|uniref:sodium:solute symporter family protein n=1 Tax=Desulfovibrio sp. TaxID=885 RepID=UPI0025BC226A|nr:sodium:solute symporter family protein [Desulfovibrio sp.]MBS6829598.1 sodium:solute symporter family protein [Desulfovibrio sp.]
MLLDALIWIAYIAVFVWLARKGQGHDALTSGRVGFGIQAFAYVATYISAVALVGFGGLAYAYGLQMLLVAAGNVWLGTWIVYRFLAWPTRVCQRNLQARTPTQLLAKGHKSPFLGKALALLFAVFLGVYASAVIKGAALLLAQILPLPLWSLIWLVALLVGFAVFVGGLRGVLYTEAMQGIVMLLGICMLVWAVFSKVGGPIQGIADLAQLAPTAQANEGFLALSSGEQGWFIISLVVVTSIAVWAQPQMIQRHFALNSAKQVNKITPLAMLVLTVLVGGAYFVASLSRLILPEVASPDDVMPTLVKMLLPNVGLQIFVLAIVSASLSTATAIFHIAVSAIAEDLPGRKASRSMWLLGIAFCVLLSGGCAQIKGQLIALLCTTSWSIVGATVLVAYVALVRFGKRSSLAAWISCTAGFTSCMLWYLLAHKSFALAPLLWEQAALIPPFFVGFAFSLTGWLLGWALDREGRKASSFWPAARA